MRDSQMLLYIAEHLRILFINNFVIYMPLLKYHFNPAVWNPPASLGENAVVTAGGRLSLLRRIIRLQASVHFVSEAWSHYCRESPAPTGGAPLLFSTSMILATLLACLSRQTLYP